MVSRTSALVVGLLMSMISSCALSAPQATYDSETGLVMLTNGRLELKVETLSGLNPNSLRDTVSGRVYADRNYVWTGGGLPTMVGAPTVTTEPDGTCRAVFVATLGSLRVEQTFTAPAAESGLITESIRIINPGTTTLSNISFLCGFAKRTHNGASWLSEVSDSHFCNVPYRRHTETGELCDYTIPELSSKQSWFSTVRSPMYGRQNSTMWGAEGWAWYKNGNTLLMTKYNPDAMEWSLVEPLADGTGKKLRFGGAGRWKLGDPEGAGLLAPGAGFTFGTTRYQVLDGEWEKAYAAFRTFTAGKGHVCPVNYNPPIQWNELYDNQLWWIGDSVANRALYYRRADMQVEADKALEIGCECLYLDPGWDTIFGSNIWDSARLGTEESFVQMLNESYGGMKLALHTPVAPWSDASTYPNLCTASAAYQDVKVARLVELYNKGAFFFMYDGSWYEPCSNASHGHSVPSTHQEHLDGILAMQQKLHQACPGAVIEQHDPMTGCGTPRYVPTYFMHAKPGAFDEHWGFEYMIDPMDDVLSMRAYSLYYYNLAYGIPVYLHIDLRKDNDQALMLWWYMSTCRHLGFGGKPTDINVWNAQKAAMVTYKQNKAFFARGVFYGLDETVHAHTLAEQNQCVINCFNVTTAAVQKEIRFKLSDIGLPQGPVLVENAGFVPEGDEIVLTVSIPARGHKLVKLTVDANQTYGLLRGTITASVGGHPPLAGAVVSVAGSASQAYTNSDGEYAMYLLAGSYMLTASKTGCQSQNASVAVIAGQTTQRNFDLVTSIVAGMVTHNASGFPGVAGATVQAVGTSYSASTDANGAYSIQLPPGLYTLQASWGQVDPVVVPNVYVPFGAEIGQDFRLSFAWDFAGDFTTWANPNGVWSYGYVSSATSLYTLFALGQAIDLNGLPAWHGGAGTAVIWKNTLSTAWTDSYSYVEPGKAAFHPDPTNGNPAVVRWTSPVSGTVTLSGRFTGQSYTPKNTTTRVVVLKNSVVSFDSNIDGFLGRASNNYTDGAGLLRQQAFTDTWTVQAGDTYDFVSLPSGTEKLFNATGLEAAVVLPFTTGVTEVGALASFPPGSTVSITQPVAVTVESGVFSDGSIYVEDPQRCAGVKVRGAGLSAPRGRRVTLSGTWGYDADGEPCISSAALISSVSGSQISPLGTVCRNLIDRRMTGLLVRAWGEVVDRAADGSWFVIDDGSGNGGTTVYLGNCAQAVTAPSLDDFVAVTGASGRRVIGGTLVEVVQPRQQSDITPF